MHFYVYRDIQSQWRWTLFAANGRKLANCGEGYHNQKDCVDALLLVASTGQNATPIKYAA